MKNSITAPVALCLFAISIFVTPVFADSITVKGKNGCVAYVPTSFGGVTWMGGCKDGMASGKGVLDIGVKSAAITATFSEGFLNGELEVKNGQLQSKCTYVRSMKNGKCWRRDNNSDMTTNFDFDTEMDGRGYKPALMADEDKARVEGEFLRGDLHGFGTLSWVAGFEHPWLKERSSGKAVARGNRMVATGLWEYGFLKMLCPTKDACEAQSRSAERTKVSRQLSNICDAQKKTCIASCPQDRVFTGRPDLNCRSECESVSCN